MRQLEDIDHSMDDLMQALSDHKQLSGCGVFLCQSIKHVLKLDTGIWAVCTRHDIMTSRLYIQPTDYTYMVNM